MYLKKLELINYKNIEESSLLLSKGLNCFVGYNGEGKTNLLDAIYYLSFCKSNYSASDLQNIKHGQEYMMLKGEYKLSDQTETIHCGVQRQTKKSVKRNGKEYPKLSEHIGLIPLVMIAPADSIIITGGSEERRKFIDSVVSQYDSLYLQKLVAYNHLLMQRNKLLKSPTPPHDLLMILSGQMAPLATYISTQRKSFLEQITPIFQKYYSSIGAAHETVSIGYESHLNNDDFEQLAEKNLQRDLALRYTSTGIHRDNLEFLLSEYPIRKEGSQGQQKSYLVSLKFAQYDFIKKASQKKPILLLDDIFDKLDSHRVQRIVEIVAQRDFGQIFITDTDKNHMNTILDTLDTENRIFYVKQGIITTNEER